MSDYISREKAINALGEQPLNWNDSEVSIAERAMWEEHKAAIENIPSENVKPVVYGKWIEYPRPHYFKCSVCKYTVPYKKACLHDSKREYNFCPHCGADMRGENK